jgi:hypothetical protein
MDHGGLGDCGATGAWSACFPPTLLKCFPSISAQSADLQVQCLAVTLRARRTHRRSQRHFESPSRRMLKRRTIRRPNSPRHTRRARYSRGKIPEILSTACMMISAMSLRLRRCTAMVLELHLPPHHSSRTSRTTVKVWMAPALHPRRLLHHTDMPYRGKALMPRICQVHRTSPGRTHMPLTITDLRDTIHHACRRPCHHHRQGHT